MLERVSSAAAGVGTSLPERIGRGVWQTTPAPSKVGLRRMEAAGQGGAGVERGRPLGLHWGWWPPASRGTALLRLGPSAASVPESTRLSEVGRSLVRGHPLTWPENLFSPSRKGN